MPTMQAMISPNTQAINKIMKRFTTLKGKVTREARSRGSFSAALVYEGALERILDKKPAIASGTGWDAKRSAQDTLKKRGHPFSTRRHSTISDGPPRIGIYRQTGSLLKSLRVIKRKSGSYVATIPPSMVKKPTKSSKFILRKVPGEGGVPYVISGRGDGPNGGGMFPRNVFLHIARDPIIREDAVLACKIAVLETVGRSWYQRTYATRMKYKSADLKKRLDAKYGKIDFDQVNIF